MAGLSLDPDGHAQAWAFAAAHPDVDDDILFGRYLNASSHTTQTRIEGLPPADLATYRARTLKAVRNGSPSETFSDKVERPSVRNGPLSDKGGA